MTTPSAPVGIATGDVLDSDRTFFDALVTGDISRLEALLASELLIVDVNAGAVTRSRRVLGVPVSRSGPVRQHRVVPR